MCRLVAQVRRWTNSAIRLFLSTASLLSLESTAAADVPPDFLQSWPTAGKPASIVVDRFHNNLVYVACENGVVQKFTSNGQLLTSWGATAPLNGIAVDVNGDVYIAEFQNCRIKKFTPQGVLILQFGSCGLADSTFSLASDVAVETSGAIHALDYGGRVLVFSSVGGFLRSYAMRGSGDGQLNNCRGITLDLAGNVLIADTENRGGRIQKFTNSGQFVRLWNEWMQEPFDVAVDPTGSVYVPSYWGHRILKFTGDGTLLTMWGSQGQGNGQFQNPRGVAADSFGNVYVADTEMTRIQKFGYAPTPVQVESWSRIKLRFQ